MNDKKVFTIAGIATLIVGCILGLLLATTLTLILVRANANSSDDLPSPTVTHTGMPIHTLLATKTPTLLPTITPTLQITGITTITSTLAITTTPTATPFFAPGGLDSWCIPYNNPTTQAQVIRVVDSLTIEVRILDQEYTVRYIGLSAPELGEGDPRAGWATAKNSELVAGKSVLLIQDKSDTDSEGRLLRYVIAGGIFVNREMIEIGYAQAATMPPDITCDPTFQETEILAKAAQRGLWAPLPTPIPTRYIPSATPTPPSSGSVTITHLFYEGIRWQEPNEFVEIKNTSGGLIQLGGWTLEDSKGHIFVFPPFLMKAGWYCRIYTDEYHPESCGFTYENFSQIWDNDEDCAILKDSDGVLIDKFCY